MDFLLFGKAVPGAVVLLAAGLALLLLTVWLVYRAVKAAVREGILEARQNQSRDNWLPTQRQSLEEHQR